MKIPRWWLLVALQILTIPAFADGTIEDGALKTPVESGSVHTRTRREILKSVEELRNFYNEKNIGAINDLYCDDTLIISGINSKNGGGDKAKYKVLTKAEYLNQLSEIFRNNNLISVDFNHIAVVAHNAKPNIYGVTLHQKWETDTYRDNGWLFMIWDFNNPNAPQIRVRTWQTEQSVDSDGILTLDDFFID